MRMIYKQRKRGIVWEEEMAHSRNSSSFDAEQYDSCFLFYFILFLLLDCFFLFCFFVDVVLFYLFFRNWIN